MYRFLETENGCDLVIYVPGYSKSDIDVTRFGNQIEIKGKSESKFAIEESIHYKFALNSFVKVDPELSNGVLILHCTRDETKSRSLNIR